MTQQFMDNPDVGVLDVPVLMGLIEGNKEKWRALDWRTPCHGV
jgi:hypothetical protein